MAETAEVAHQASVYCLIPRALESELLEPLRAHYADDPRVEVIVEQRVGPRRSGIDRRALNLEAPETDRRRSGRDRRQRADRRAPQIPRELAPLPPPFDAHADRIRWAQRLAPVSRGTESLPLPELIAAIHAGDPGATTEFYWRMFERVYSRLRQQLGRYTNPDGHMPRTFGRLLDELEHYRVEDSFDEWFYGVIDEFAVDLPRQEEPPKPERVRAFSTPMNETAQRFSMLNRAAIPRPWETEAPAPAQGQ
jgi:hypothetical protein